MIPTPPGPPAGLGARVEVPVTGAIVTAWGPAQIGTDWATVTLDAPVLPGMYLIHWMTLGAQSIYDAFFPLGVQSTAGAAMHIEWPIIDPAAIRPDVDDIALLERIRTVDLSTGQELGTFTGNTRPTAGDVEGLIDKAVDDIRSMMARPNIDPARYPQVKRAIEFYAAMLVEGSYTEAQQTDRATMWQAEYQEAVKSLNEDITRDIAQNNLLGGMEPRLV
jgi:hypothetical protein